jgi:hypothetical protein
MPLCKKCGQSEAWHIQHFPGLSLCVECQVEEAKRRVAGQLYGACVAAKHHLYWRGVSRRVIYEQLAAAIQAAQLPHIEEDGAGVII